MVNVEEGHYGARRPGSQGNSRERLKVVSGHIIVIDQFMLGNEQFLEKIRGLSRSNPDDAEAITAAIEMFGGCLLPLAPGEYDVLRSPEQTLIVLRPAAPGAPQDVEDDDFESVLDTKGNLAPSHRVFVDTRCLVFVDADLLAQAEPLEHYRALRAQGDEKQARDFIREYGGAVRYGFNRYGDELGVFTLPDEQSVALWPDVVE